MAPLTDEIVAFLAGSVSLLAATRDASLEPWLSRALAVRIAADRASITVFVAKRAGAELLERLAPGSPLALTASHVPTLRTVQLKGAVTAVRAARPEEREAIEAQAGGFTEDIGVLGFPLPVVRRLVTWPAVAVEARVWSCFDQTPGPGAGRPMGAG